MATIRVALTGGIATGKSFCLARFADRGVPVINADTLAHEAIASGTPGHASVVARFGAEVVAADGTIDRRALARIMFDDVKARRDLEALIHPVVYRAIDRWFAGLGDAGAALGLAEIPLLYETGREIDFDRVIVAACPQAMQIERLMARSALSAAEAAQRIAAQLPIDEKAARADFVIDTSGSIEETENQISAVFEELRQ